MSVSVLFKKKQETIVARTESILDRGREWNQMDSRYAGV